MQTLIALKADLNVLDVLSGNPSKITDGKEDNGKDAQRIEEKRKNLKGTEEHSRRHARCGRKPIVTHAYKTTLYSLQKGL